MDALMSDEKNQESTDTTQKEVVSSETKQLLELLKQKDNTINELMQKVVQLSSIILELEKEIKTKNTNSSEIKEQLENAPQTQDSTKKPKRKLFKFSISGMDTILGLLCSVIELGSLVAGSFFTFSSGSNSGSPQSNERFGGSDSGSGSWLLPITFFLIFVIVACIHRFLYKRRKNRKEQNSIEQKMNEENK